MWLGGCQLRAVARRKNKKKEKKGKKKKEAVCGFLWSPGGRGLGALEDWEG